VCAVELLSVTGDRRGPETGRLSEAGVLTMRRRGRLSLLPGTRLPAKLGLLPKPTRLPKSGLPPRPSVVAGALLAGALLAGNLLAGNLLARSARLARYR
jgi:hypothetical protein